LRYAVSFKVAGLVLYRDWFFRLRVNAQRSGCPINLTLETLWDRPSVKGALLSMHRTTVSPTFIHTDGTAPFLADAGNRKATLAHIPLGRIGETDDVVGAVVFLASPAASLITGANLLVDGGWSVA
jgi:hypothetical protein